jgi:hypothetical protein
MKTPRIYRWVVLSPEDGDISTCHPAISLGDRLRGRLRGDILLEGRIVTTNPVREISGGIVKLEGGSEVILGSPERNI